MPGLWEALLERLGLLKEDDATEAEAKLRERLAAAPKPAAEIFAAVADSCFDSAGTRMLSYRLPVLGVPRPAIRSGSDTFQKAAETRVFVANALAAARIVSAVPGTDAFGGRFLKDVEDMVIDLGLRRDFWPEKIPVWRITPREGLAADEAETVMELVRRVFSEGGAEHARDGDDYLLRAGAFNSAVSAFAAHFPSLVHITREAGNNTLDWGYVGGRGFSRGLIVQANREKLTQSREADPLLALLGDTPREPGFKGELALLKALAHR
ncbi:hypothetical protein, partial [Sutterella sp.]|uniref:hypothetical protein n=1 Tax=Sutterella sp. TaxID=1981025 RepID=UPI0026E0B21B